MLWDIWHDGMGMMTDVMTWRNVVPHQQQLLQRFNYFVRTHARTHRLLITFAHSHHAVRTYRGNSPGYIGRAIPACREVQARWRQRLFLRPHAIFISSDRIRLLLSCKTAISLLSKFRLRTYAFYVHELCIITVSTSAAHKPVSIYSFSTGQRPSSRGHAWNSLEWKITSMVKR